MPPGNVPAVRAHPCHAAQGLGRFTAAALAAEVGLTDGALFRHFPTKDAIVLAAIARVAILVLRTSGSSRPSSACTAPERAPRTPGCSPRAGASIRRSPPYVPLVHWAEGVRAAAVAPAHGAGGAPDGRQARSDAHGHEPAGAHGGGAR